MNFNVGIQQYYIYVISHMGEEVTGIVTCEDLMLQKNIKILQHENTLLNKLYFLEKEMQLRGVQDTPIIIGYKSQHQLRNIIENISKRLIFKEVIGQELHTIFELDIKDQLLIQKVFQEKNTFLLLDGHHRYNILKSFDYSKRMMFWIVPIEQMQVKMFLKKITIKNVEQFHDSLCNLNSKIAKSNFVLYYQQKFIRINQFINDNLNSLEAIQNFITWLNNRNLLVDIEYCSCSSRADLLDILDTVKECSNKFIIIPQRITEKTFIDAILEGKCLPVHSTCFLPKPLSGLFNCYL